MVALPFTFFTSAKITVVAPRIYEISLLVLRKNISRVSDLVSLSMHVIIYLQKMNPPLKECGFQMRRISFNYSLGDNTPVSEEYHVVASMSTNNSEYNAITSNRFGKVSLGYWKDCGAWLNISLAI